MISKISIYFHWFQKKISIAFDTDFLTLLALRVVCEQFIYATWLKDIKKSIAQYG